MHYWNHVSRTPPLLFGVVNGNIQSWSLMSENHLVEFVSCIVEPAHAHGTFGNSERQELRPLGKDHVPAILERLKRISC